MLNDPRTKLKYYFKLERTGDVLYAYCMVIDLDYPNSESVNDIHSAVIVDGNIDAAFKFLKNWMTVYFNHVDDFHKEWRELKKKLKTL